MLFLWWLLTLLSRQFLWMLLLLLLTLALLLTASLIHSLSRKCRTPPSQTNSWRNIRRVIRRVISRFHATSDIANIIIIIIIIEQPETEVVEVREKPRLAEVLFFSPCGVEFGGVKSAAQAARDQVLSSNQTVNGFLVLIEVALVRRTKVATHDETLKWFISCVLTNVLLQI